MIQEKEIKATLQVILERCPEVGQGHIQKKDARITGTDRFLDQAVHH